MIKNIKEKKLNVFFTKQVLVYILILFMFSFQIFLYMLEDITMVLNIFGGSSFIFMLVYSFDKLYKYFKFGEKSITFIFILF